ncbi:GGDEF domain-containing protein [Denitratisoma sp. DHT3]|uniref:GGDEF domain-containing protein n=1 Tax=Denitratisoma sp. DHT3 TaxID=1981880 RepID=UPI0011989654|nr:GGDEF domain-containing protein [Denitratisoma sp. DHT3]QDX80852.1 GGDEF domain-containing protein [Denitratisoma sp. DHT3]
MLNSQLSRLWLKVWAVAFTEMSSQEISWLLRPGGHISLLSSRRSGMIISRVRLIALLFAVLTPLWSLLDIWAFPPETWHGLVAMRLFSTIAFAALVIALRRSNGMVHAYRAMGFLLAVPTTFFLFSYLHMAQFNLSGLQEAFAVGYAYLPFVMLAGLSVFPLTAAESLGFAAPMLLAQIAAAGFNLPILHWPTFAASFWLLMLITAVSVLAGLSQLAFMIVLVREAMRDRMTGCFSHTSGEELLELQFIISTRSGTPLSLVFIDLDHFKQINDQYGHEAGDRILTKAAESIRGCLRTGDILVRWGGEEFVLIMPNTDAVQATIAMERVRGIGLGDRPDGTPVTASIGIAERTTDTVGQWRELVEKADSRMYEAKHGGRNRVVGPTAMETH